MTYIMAFHPDNIIRRKDKQDITLTDFRAANPFVPLVDGQFFQLDEDRLIIMNEKGQGDEVNMMEYAELIDSINNPPALAIDKFFSNDIVIDAYLELDVIQVSIPNNDNIPTGFTVDVNSVQQWQYRDKNAAELIVDSNNVALIEIVRLESEVTQRRLREGALSVDGGWLANQDALITIERNKLQ